MAESRTPPSITKGCTRSTHSGGCEVVGLSFVPGEPRRYPQPNMNYTELLLAILLLIGGCSRAPHESSNTWSSQHFDVTAKLLPGWKKSYLRVPGDTFDKPHELLVAFSNDLESCGYIIKIAHDVPLSKISNEKYLQTLKELSQSSGYEFVDESKVQLHGQTFDRLRFVATGAKGLISSAIHSFRDGKHSVYIHWIHPIANRNDTNLHDSVSRFNKHVALPLLNGG